MRPLHMAARTVGGAAAVRTLLHFGANPLSMSADGKRASEGASRLSRVLSKQLFDAEAVWDRASGPTVPRSALVVAVRRGWLMRIDMCTYRHVHL